MNAENILFTDEIISPFDAMSNGEKKVTGREIPHVPENY